MGFLKFFLFLSALLPVVSVHAGLEAPPLRVMPFEDLRFPVKLNKTEIQWMLQRAMDEMYGKTFVDMGDVTDLMHGHVIMKPADGFSTPILDNLSLESLLAAPLAQSSDLEPMAILFHTHEYDELRKGMPYVGPYGELDPYNRNWILFLVDADGHKRGDLVDANEYYASKNGKKTYTINPDDLPEELFGFEVGDWSYSFYFFRTDCEVSDLISGQDSLSLTEVYNSLNKERVCLNLTSFHCRNNPDDAKNCGGTSVPLYDIFKNWNP